MLATVQNLQKLVLALTTFLLIARANIKNISKLLDWVPYIYYPIYFKKMKFEL